MSQVHLQVYEDISLSPACENVSLKPAYPCNVQKRHTVTLDTFTAVCLTVPQKHLLQPTMNCAEICMHFNEDSISPCEESQQDSWKLGGEKVTSNLGKKSYH